MNDLETTLRQTLGHAAEQAPHAPATLAVHLEGRHRRGRQRAQAMGAAAAVVVVAAGTAFVLRGGPEAAGPATSVGLPTTVASAATTSEATLAEDEEKVLPRPPAIDQVWPAAVRKIPAKLPDGRAYRPELFLDDHTLLIETSSSFEKTDGIYAYDLGTGEVRKIADVPTPKGTVLFASDFTVGDGQVVWWTALKGGTAQLWSAPVTGGESKIVASHQAPVPTEERDNDAALDRLAIGNGKIMFSFRSGGVFTVPLGGGTVEPVPGAEKFHVLSWPWVGSGGEYGPVEGARFDEILNVETGETNTAVTHPGERNVTCDTQICSGEREEGKPFIRSRDGSQQRDLPGTRGPVPPPTGGRFFTTPTRDGIVLHDLTTGTSADLGIRPDKKGSMSLPMPEADGRLLGYQLGDQYVIVDLSKL
ncbi:hypothetical protein ACFSKW_50130 [Nonomuraea mangrovi]|uniref:WD40 repeat domain-containing protein n=1 Tax=Nonomuraea mangrovi TaxID=2316207 RepID=A0ABW4TD76_9ACTN